MPVEPVSESPFLLSQRPKGYHLGSVVGDHGDVMQYVARDGVELVLYYNYFVVCKITWD